GFAAPFHSTLTTMTLYHRSLSRFAAKPCRSATRGLLSSQIQLLLAHKRNRFTFRYNVTVLDTARKPRRSPAEENGSLKDAIGGAMIGRI
ncbi:MAG TPA: hypothetical protein VFW23_00285, partial [Tepidisphaeraceae bacterium]|nr:hypothetical protein [Tepidisphaeraceae bacterium]